jgi:hypothetical protein
MLNKKGAMFGLDARIALAIFGALSVISGAALYSAIQESRVVALITELNEVSKAVEQYVLDTGIEPALSADDNLRMHELITSSEEGWQGPYLSYEPSNLHNLDHPIYNHWGIIKGKKFGYSDGDVSNNEACDANICDIYVYVNGVPFDLAKAVDERVDGALSIDSGRVFLSYGFTGANDVYNTGVGFKVMPALNKP